MKSLEQSAKTLELVYDVTEHLRKQMVQEPAQQQRLCQLLVTSIMLVRDGNTPEPKEGSRMLQMLGNQETVERLILRMMEAVEE